MRTPGGFWRRLYSAPSTSRTTWSTTAGSKPSATSSAAVRSSLDVAPGARGRAPRRAAASGRRAGRAAARPTAACPARCRGWVRAVLEHGLRVAVPAQLVDERLGHVLDHGEPARGVAVERRVAGRHLALVARGEHDPPLGVRHGHEEHAAKARLEVLVGEPEGLAPEHRRQHARRRRRGPPRSARP